MSILLKDATPSLLKQLTEDPSLKKQQAQALREMLAIAGEAVKEGMLDAQVKDDLENIRVEISAQLYDRQINKDKDAFATVTAAGIKAYYAKPGNNAAFEKYLESRLAEAKKQGSMPADRVLTDEEKGEVRDSYARLRIYDAEAKLKARQLGAAYTKRASLKTRLQQNQYLAELYSQRVLVAKTKVTDSEVQDFINAHKELYEPQKLKAEGILARAKAGEDFAALANEFSEDPGNKGENGIKLGGSYKDVPRGTMVRPFENAALALEPGSISPGLVETDFGYHIIKLDRKGETYDVRHILISTMLSDPNNRFARPTPLKETVRNKLEDEKQEKVINEILKNNPVTVAEDYDIPAPPATDPSAKLGTD